MVRLLAIRMLLNLPANTYHTFSYTDSTELNKPDADEVRLEHFEMNANGAYSTNTAEITTTENVAYMTVGDVLPPTRNVTYRQVPPGTDECYEYIFCDER